MLENLDLEQELTKEEYNRQLEALSQELGLVQRQAREAGRPVMLVFEGWRGARRSRLINKMMQQLDSRGFKVHSSARIPVKQLAEGPFFTYFWQNLPAKGAMAVYHHSWYYLKNARDFGHLPKQVPAATFEQINSFEEALVKDNYIILKFFLHLSPKRQRKNLKGMQEELGPSWREVNPAYDESGSYGEYLEAYEKMLAATDTAAAPWQLIAAEDLRLAQVQVFSSIIRLMKEHLSKEQTEPKLQPRPEAYNVLGRFEPYQALEKEEYKARLEDYQQRLAQLQLSMYKAGIGAVIGFEGWDAGGKGGAIRRLTASLDPLGYTVQSVAAPNAVERQYHYLWRFWQHLPKAGQISIFDRTWYGRVMVERIEGFAKAWEWQRAYEEIKEMEAQWADHGLAIAKFWLQIDQEEQLRRFQERQQNPFKQWKITEEDWRNREKWPAYEAAVNEMLMRTDTPQAPWTVVEGNNKYYARLKVLQTVIDLFEHRLGL